MQYWLFKSEPSSFSLDDLIKAPNQTTEWEGVRNYQARNFMRDKMQVGDLGFFYHSNCNPPGVVGVVKIVRASHPDLTAFDPKSIYYDPKSTKDNPRWFLVSVKFIKKFKQMITLDTLKNRPKLKNFALIKPGTRLSVMPVSQSEWNDINEVL